MSVTVRFRFSRKGPVRYLGHLDMLRYFQKAVMRSGIPARYTEGFHPHQIMSFAYPLGVAMETTGDYMDLELTEALPAEALCAALNAVMHEGIAVEAAVLLPEGAPNAMASVAAADYEILAAGDGTETLRTELLTAVVDLLAEEELFLQPHEDEKKPERDRKGGKKEKKPKDIRKGILSLEVKEEPETGGETAWLSMRLLSGSAMNVRPADVFDLLVQRTKGRKITALKIVRREIYGEKDGSFVPLLELGADG